MQLGGFSLKKTKKKAVGGNAAPSGIFESSKTTSNEPKKIYVTDFDPEAVARARREAEEKEKLVIPLIKTNEWKKPVEKNAADGKESEETAEELSVDEQAAREIIASVSTTSETTDDVQRSDFTIPMQNADSTGTKSAPILLQNAVPGMDDLADVNEKYRHDISLRPQELDVRSSVYEQVPVEEFGVAMLRGMGWNGSFKDMDADDAAPKPRHKLLGLGAKVRPTLPNESKKKGKKVQKAKVDSQESSKPQNGLRVTKNKESKRDESRERRPSHYRESSSKRTRERSQDSPERRGRKDRKKSPERDRRRRSRSRDRSSGRRRR